jgi:hypothetical protein
MSKRILLAVFFLLTLTQGMAVRGQQDEKRTDEKITPAEEREALLIARRFVKDFEEKNDLLSLMDELYIKDFDARLRPNLNDYSYIASVSTEVKERASREDLRRFYGAALGFYYAGNFLYGVEAYKRKLSGDESRDNAPPIHELLPQNVIDVLKTDPLLARMVAEAEEEARRRSSVQSDETQPVAANGTGGEIEAEGNGINSVERMRHYVTTLEKASALIRAHLKTLQVPQTWDELIRATKSDEEDATKGTGNDACESMRPRVRILSQNSFGMPKGTRLIWLKVLPFHMELVRIDGSLRILNVYVVD